jgi:hypothetical protein
VHAALETLAIALYVKVDDDLKSRPELAKPRRSVDITPKLTDAELVTMAVVRVLLNIRSASQVRCCFSRQRCDLAYRCVPVNPLGPLRRCAGPRGVSGRASAGPGGDAGPGGRRRAARALACRNGRGSPARCEASEHHPSIDVELLAAVLMLKARPGGDHGVVWVADSLDALHGGAASGSELGTGR